MKAVGLWFDGLEFQAFQQRTVQKSPGRIMPLSHTHLTPPFCVERQKLLILVPGRRENIR